MWATARWATVFTLLLVGLTGCGNRKKTEAPTGPRVTSGNVNPDAKPAELNVGGSVAPK